MLRELRGSPGSHVKCRAGSVSGTPNGLNGAHSAHSQQLHPGSGDWGLGRMPAVDPGPPVAGWFLQHRDPAADHFIVL